MRPRFLLQFSVILMAVFFSGRLDAQVVPKNIVFVSSVGSGLPPVTSSAIFMEPTGVAISVSTAPGSVTGAIYVADPLNNQVVDFPPNGTTTLLNALPCPPAVTGCVLNPWVLNMPTAVAAAPDGGVWISDTGNDVVIEVDKTGTVERFAGQGPSNVVCGGGCPPHPNSGHGNGQFFGPGALAVDSNGNLYVADGAGGIVLGERAPQANYRLQSFNSNGAFITTWGSYCDLTLPGTPGCNMSAPGAMVPGDGQFAFVTGIAVDDVSNIYAADQNNNRVQKFHPNGTFLLKWGGLPYVSTDGQFNQPGGIAVSFDRTVYVVDSNNHRIEEFDTSGNFIGKGGSFGEAEAQFKNPQAIAAVPPAIAFTCSLGLVLGNESFLDCVHGLVVSEFSSSALGNNRVQVLAGRPDTANDGITDEVSVTPGVFSNNFTDSGLGFTTSGTIVDRGDQTFVIYNTLSPNAIDEIRIRTESFGGATPLTLTVCGAPINLAFSAGTGANVHCSTPTVTTEFGPVGFKFVGGDGTVSTASLNTGASLSVDVSTSEIVDNAGTIALVVGGKSVTLTPGQTVFSLTPNFSLNPVSSISILEGGSATSLASVNSLSGFDSAVALSVSGAPPGVSASLTPNSVTPFAGGSASSMLTVSLGPSVPIKPFLLTVTGVSGSLIHSISVHVSVIAPVYSVGVTSVGPMTVTSGGNYSVAVKLTNNGNVTLSSLDILKATLNTTAAMSLPGPIANLTPGASAVVTLVFPSSAGPAGKTAALKIVGGYDGVLPDGATQPGGFSVALFEVLP
jgi:hypothetical protein